ncbi:winged helix-turn-helix transcriptional regulator [Kaustia mangrovi]|uniref:Winged helix-turn-helix transcriptional regulator n=1 Tax=Kaustia mangrovi TaxID=2593653 RepID=A0A7S8C5E8_9HYPH|nr:winged helix-turn-helix domain-containing protein [Kaustia mangrovi]QPC43718.1 winged helix-turn-helix transcriptional regulator [Kaustia mangrovi]
MTSLDPHLDIPASALADRSRMLIVAALMDGRAYTAKELAYRAGISPQTASFHLQRLSDAGLILCHPQGRHRYYRLAGEDVAAAIETMMTIAPREHLKRQPMRAGCEIAFARSCYDHLAGALGVALAERMSDMGAVLSHGRDFALTPRGLHLARDIGLDPDGLARPGRPMIRHCLDWTERRFHFAGSLGKGLLGHFLAENWLRRGDGTRALAVTAKGQQLFKTVFEIDTDALAGESAARREAG